MARRATPAPRAASEAAVIQTLTAAGISPEAAQVVSGNALVASAAQYRINVGIPTDKDRNQIAKNWQIEAYRHVKICGEARYAATLFASTAARAEIGVSEPQALRGKPKWVNTGPEVDVFAQFAPTVRERTRLVRDYMIHRTIAGECYLIARERQPTDFGYVDPPSGAKTWDDYIRDHNQNVDLLDADSGPDEETGNPNIDNPIWEIVAVTELRRVGEDWEVRHDNDNWVKLRTGDPVIRMWNPDPENRREAWSPFQSLLPTLREIEWLTMHIFTQVRSRLMSSGVWFLPENLTFPAPPPSSVNGGAETIASMNEAEQFMATLAASSMKMLDADDVAMPTVIMADSLALAAVAQDKLIKFWSDIDDKAMILRNAAIRRFGEGFDMPADRVSSSSGTDAQGNSSGNSGANHWGEWAKNEQTISDHIEPALDEFVGTLTDVMRSIVDGTRLVIAYGTASLRLRQDRSKEAMELYDRGLLKGSIAITENGFDAENDMMDPEEHKMWLLNRVVSGQFTPEQMAVVFKLLTGVDMPTSVPGSEIPKGLSGPDQPSSLDDHPTQGPPEGDHEHHDAPFSALVASAEGLVLRALEKAGNRLLNDGKRGKDRDRNTPAHLAHLTASVTRTTLADEFDFSLAAEVGMEDRVEQLGRFCADLYNEGEPYSRAALVEALEGSA